jgi:Mrp family chromosome partitioning ATPase/capsular polysaccharide biosynthesis protein
MAFDTSPVLPVNTETPEQALGPYLRAVRRRWLLLAAVTLLTFAVAAVTTLRGSPKYEADAKVLVSPVQQGESNLVNVGVVVEGGEPVRTVQTAAALVDSLPAAQAVAARLGNGWTAARVQQAVSVTPLGESNVLKVTATSDTAVGAARLANAFASASVGYRASIVQRNIQAQLNELNNRLQQASSSGTTASAALEQELAARIAALRSVQVSGGDPSLSVTEAATPPGSPSGAPHWLILLLSLIGGFAIGSVAALAAEFFDRRVRDLDDVAELFPVPVLAAIPNVESRGRRRALRPDAFPPFAFEQLRMLRVQLSYRERSRAIMITSAGAGDGKTTLATALAAAFAETGEEVILMDLDLRKPAVASLLEISQPRPVSLVEATLPELLVPVPDLPGVRVLPAPRGGAALLSMQLARLPKLLEEAKAEAGHVIVDAAPVGVASESLQIAKLCDQLVMVARPRHTDRQLLVLARDMLARAGAPLVGVVVVAESTPTPDDMHAYGYAYGFVAPEEPPGEDVVATKKPPRARHLVRE